MVLDKAAAQALLRTPHKSLRPAGSSLSSGVVVLHVVSPRWPCVVLLLAACRSGEEEQDGRGKGRSTTEGARGGWFAVAWLFRVCVLFGVVSGFFVDILARDLRSQKGATAVGGSAFV